MKNIQCIFLHNYMDITSVLDDMSLGYVMALFLWLIDGWRMVVAVHCNLLIFNWEYSVFLIPVIMTQLLHVLALEMCQPFLYWNWKIAE